MIVELRVLYDDLNPNGGRGRDKVIRAIDRIGNFTWEKSGEGFVARE